METLGVGVTEEPAAWTREVQAENSKELGDEKGKGGATEHEVGEGEVKERPDEAAECPVADLAGSHEV